MEINILSSLLGAAIAVTVAVVVFFLNQYVLFKTRIMVPRTFDQDRYAFNFLTPEHKEHVGGGGVMTLIKVTGFKPARGVEIFFEGDFNYAEFTPSIPFQIDIEKRSIKIGVLNRGIYNIIVENRNAGDKMFLSLKGVESADAISVERSTRPRQFVFNPLIVPVAFFVFSVAVLTTTFALMLLSRQ